MAAILLLMMVAAVLSGCGNRQASPAPVPNDGRSLVQSLDARTDRADGVSRAAHLEALARSVNGVRGANCVVFGRYAIVGIDVDPKMERARVGTLKYAVAEAFRKDPLAVDALVTADLDMAQRLREIRADTMNGRPIAGFAEELADIVGRLMPQIPRNIVPPQAPENTGR